MGSISAAICRRPSSVLATDLLYHRARGKMAMAGRMNLQTSEACPFTVTPFWPTAHTYVKHISCVFMVVEVL